MKPQKENPPFRLPAPFAWIDIPAGNVTLIDGHGTFYVPAFQISKYPVTVAQYQQFMADSGYSNQQWWTEVGWEAKEQALDVIWDSEANDYIVKSKGNTWIQPIYWGEELYSGGEYSQFHQPDQPITGVSWYEA